MVISDSVPNEGRTTHMNPTYPVSSAVKVSENIVARKSGEFYELMIDSKNRFKR